MMDLQKVEPIYAETSQAAFALCLERPRAPVGSHLCPLPRMAALCEYEDFFSDSPGLERLPDDLLGMTEPVRGGGVHPRDAAVDRSSDRADGGRVVRPLAGAPGAGAAGLPATDPDPADRAPVGERRVSQGTTSRWP